MQIKHTHNSFTKQTSQCITYKDLFNERGVFKISFPGRPFMRVSKRSQKSFIDELYL